MSVSVMKGGKDGGRTGMGIICRLSVSGIWKLKMLPAGWETGHSQGQGEDRGLENGECLR